MEMTGMLENLNLRGAQSRRITKERVSNREAKLPLHCLLTKGKPKTEKNLFKNMSKLRQFHLSRMQFVQPSSKTILPGISLPETKAGLAS